MLANAPCESEVIFLLMSPTSNKTERLEDIIGLQNPYYATSNYRSFSSGICPNGCPLLLDEPWPHITSWYSI